MHIFGKENEFQVKYQTLREKYIDDLEFQKELDRFECFGELIFIVNGKNLFGMDYENDKSFTTFTGSLFSVIRFFCENLYYQIIDDPFPKETIAQNGIDMMEEVKLIKGEDNDISKYADFDFDSIDMDLYEKIDVWNWRHGFVGNSGAHAQFPDIYMRKVNGNKIEVSWDSTTTYTADKGDYYFLHGKGVDYIDLKLYRDTVVAFCQDFFERLGQHFPLFIDEFKAELQKAIDVKL